MKKKLVKAITFCIIFAAAITLFGCTKDSTGVSKTQNENADKKVTITAIVAGLTEDSPSGVALKKFAKLCDEYSQGTVEIDTFFNTELGSVMACVDSCAQGTIGIVSTGTSYFSGYVPEIQVFELPFIFDTYVEAHKTLDGEPGEKVGELFADSGLKLLAYWESGMRHVTSNKNQISSVDDMRGQKIRTVVSATQQATWEAFGAIPMALDMGEMFTALQNGTVDAQENTLSSIATYKMYEVQDYMSMTSHNYTPMPFMINETIWNNLSKSQQESIQKAAYEARDLARQLNAESEEENINLIEDKGVEIEFNPDRESFKGKVQPVYNLFNDSINDDTLLKSVQDFVEDLR